MILLNKLHEKETKLRQLIKIFSISDNSDLSVG